MFYLYCYYKGTFNFVDINECTTLSDICPDHSDCVNNDGSYTCVCNNGYKYNSVTDTCDSKYTTIKLEIF